MLYSNILETVGNTPIVKLNKIGPDDVNIYVKIESFNPMGSVKDRLALNVIEQAEKDGTLKPGQTVIEATSGNTGIGLAMVCAQKGYPLVVTMAESFSVERRRMMRFLGAKVVLTPASLKGSGMLAKATELAEKHDWFLVRQFENEANADAHSKTTAPEMDEDEAPLAVEEDAREFLDTVTSDAEQPVVMFALEWCEFSWSVRKMFAHYDIPYRSIDLDSVAYQEGNRGGKIRAAIQEQTGLKTIPQIYIGGKHVGGATELFDAAKDGSMAELLKANKVSWSESENRDPYTFLPGWLHAR